MAKNSVGVTEIVFFVVAAAAPLTAIVGASPPAFAFGNGAGVPGTFLLAGLLYIVFAVGFTAMSRHVGGAGAFYTYITQGIGKPAGVGGALMALLTYSAVQIAIYALFGVFTAGAFEPLGLSVPWWVWSYASLVLVMLCGRRNISFSGAILGICMIAEIAILLLLDIGILVRGGGPEGFDVSSFTPSVVFGPGVGVAFVFVIGSFIGFEATAIFSEEAKTPEKTIPRATYVAVTLITVFYAFSSWAIVQYYGATGVQAAANASLETFYFGAADMVLGVWSSQVMNVLLITSLFACLLSFHNTLNRYFFALGREGLAMKILGSVHELHGSPHVAGLFQSIFAAVVLGLFVALNSDPYTLIFSWMSALAVLGILAVQALVCVAIISYFRKTNHAHGLWVTTIAPVVALLGLICAFILVVNNLSLLAGTQNLIIDSFPVIVIAVGLLGAAFATHIRKRRPELYSNLGRVFE